jgi:hypothetical protein
MGDHRVSIAAGGIAATTHDSEARFHFRIACAMALVLAAGFAIQFAAGRSSFSAPPLVHVHAVLFTGWVAIYLLQNWLVASGAAGTHRKLGWIAAALVPVMLLVGTATTVNAVQMGRVPFFFLPQIFLIYDPATLLCFAGLTTLAIMKRRQTDWHRRLHLCAIAAMLGPGFGRILPMPLMGPYSFEIAALLGLVFPLWAMAREVRRGEGLHPAWAIGVPALPLTLLAGFLLGHSALGAGLYAAAVAGTPGAAIPGLAYGPPPPGM